MTDTPSAPKPIRTVRIGAVQAAIWRNEGEKGPFYNVTVERRYRDQNEEWQSSHSFGRDDLLVLAKIVDAAHSLICSQQSKDREAQRQQADHDWSSGGPDTEIGDASGSDDDGGGGGAVATDEDPSHAAARTNGRRRSR